MDTLDPLKAIAHSTLTTGTPPLLICPQQRSIANFNIVPRSADTPTQEIMQRISSDSLSSVPWVMDLMLKFPRFWFDFEDGKRAQMNALPMQDRVNFD